MKKNKKIKVVTTSDWHGTLPQIPKCDILLIAGDIVPLEEQDSLRRSLIWFEHVFLPHIKTLACKKCFFIGGNHDFFLTADMASYINAIIKYHGLSKKLVYLLDDTVEYKGLRIYGCPWIVSPRGWAFYSSCPKWIYSRIPANLDILLCHQAPLIDGVGKSNIGTKNEKEWGSPELAYAITKSAPRYVFCGHIHSGNHAGVTIDNTTIYNVSLLNEAYMESYPPRMITIEAGYTQNPDNIE